MMRFVQSVSGIVLFRFELLGVSWMVYLCGILIAGFRFEYYDLDA